MEKIINYTISKKAAKVKWEPFDVPTEMDVLRILVGVPEKCRCMGFVAVKDPLGQVRLQKFLGYGEQNLAVGTSSRSTSIGGVPGKLKPGEWQLGLGMFTEYVWQKLGSREITMKVLLTDSPGEITEPLGDWVWTEEGRLCLSSEKYGWDKVYCPHSRWYKGDFHTHTTLSDGKETRSQAMKKAQKMELDFYVPTEHNLLHTGWINRELCILPGTEITTDRGHFNLFGVTEVPERLWNLVTDSQEEGLEQYVREIMQEAREKGWLISLNHPFLTIWSWRGKETLLSDFDCIEIVNDPTYMDGPKSNERAIQLVDALWQEGYRIYGIGGSDSHNLEDEYYPGAVSPSIPGDPATYVYCNCLTPENLLSSVKQGHVCVSRFCSIEPYITIDGRHCLPGDTLSAAAEEDEMGELSYSIKIRGLQKTPVVLIVRNGERLPLPTFIQEDGAFEAKYNTSVNLREWTWVRMDIKKENGEFLGYVNPVYCGSKMPQLKTFGDITKCMGEDWHD